MMHTSHDPHDWFCAPGSHTHVVVVVRWSGGVFDWLTALCVLGRIRLSGGFMGLVFDQIWLTAVISSRFTLKHISLIRSPLFSRPPDTRYPDSVAVTFDPVTRWLSCVYNDHSLYVWDTRDLRKVCKVYSALYHSACVWDLQVNIRSHTRVHWLSILISIL